MKLLFDGAFGTYYRKVTGSADMCEKANVTDRDTVLKIHREYIDAGANAIKTNTFCADSLVYKNKDSLSAIIKNGYALASEAARGRNVLVFADIGVISDESAAERHLETVRMFTDCGAKNFLFETLEDLAPILPSLNFIKATVPAAIVGISFAVSQDGYTATGKYYKNLFDEASETDADFIGLNCSCGPLHMKKLFADVDVTTKVLSAMPNSSYPNKVNGRLEYRDNPEYFSEVLRDIYKSGVSVIGGCCGTTPEHIRMAAEKISSLPELNAVAESVYIPEMLKDKPEIRYSPFSKALDEGRFVTIVEIDPPTDCDASFLMKAAAKMKAAGADAVTIADSPLANARADSFMFSAKIRREVGIDTIPHLSCRDRNRIAIKGALLAAASENVGNVLAVTGDAIQSYKALDKSVFNLNSLKLISYISEMNTGVFSLRPYRICAALNVNAPNFEAELIRALAKEKEGATAFFTQAIFTEESVRSLITARAELKSPILAGILPVASYKNAVFLNNEVSGIDIPQEFITSLENKTPEEVSELSVAYSLGIIGKIRAFCNGLYIMMPLRRTELIEKLLHEIKNTKDE